MKIEAVFGAAALIELMRQPPGLKATEDRVEFPDIIDIFIRRYQNANMFLSAESIPAELIPRIIKFAGEK
jgi:hypothetical protein